MHFKLTTFDRWICWPFTDTLSFMMTWDDNSLRSLIKLVVPNLLHPMRITRTTINDCILVAIHLRENKSHYTRTLLQFLFFLKYPLPAITKHISSSTKFYYHEINYFVSIARTVLVMHGNVLTWNPS